MLTCSSSTVWLVLFAAWAWRAHNAHNAISLYKGHCSARDCGVYNNNERMRLPPTGGHKTLLPLVPHPPNPPQRQCRCPCCLNTGSQTNSRPAPVIFFTTVTPCSSQAQHSCPTAAWRQQQQHRQRQRQQQQPRRHKTAHALPLNHTANFLLVTPTHSPRPHPEPLRGGGCVTYMILYVEGCRGLQHLPDQPHAAQTELHSRTKLTTLTTRQTAPHFFLAGRHKPCSTKQLNGPPMPLPTPPHPAANLRHGQSAAFIGSVQPWPTSVGRSQASCLRHTSATGKGLMQRSHVPAAHTSTHHTCPFPLPTIHTTGCWQCPAHRIGLIGWLPQQNKTN